MINVIWEGTSNICSLDLWRAISKDGGQEAVFERVEDLISGVETDAAGRLAEATRSAVDELKGAVSYLSGAGQARQQQARRLANLFGDVVALAALTREADRTARQGDYRKALVGEIFATRLTTPETPASTLTEGYLGVPELYEPLVAWEGCSKEDYDGYLRTLGRS